MKTFPHGFLRSILALLTAASTAVAADATNQAAVAAQKLPRLPAVEPAAAAATFKAEQGFKMELLAAEPLVTDPVAMVYDENGLAYVVEMNDYPYTDAKAHQAWKDNTTDNAIGKIRLLEDTDGDGKFDKSYVFAENLSWASGIVCWKGGVFVTATPDVWYLKDTDGDRKADVRKKVFTGFRKYNVQAVINNPLWGLDNKIYAAGAGNGGSIVSPEKNEKPVPMSRNDFRFDPVSEKFETLSGGARFGNAFDDWGNRFICNIRNPAQHIVLQNEYLARNPFLPVKTAIHDIAKAGDTLPVYRISPVEPWREARARAWSTDPAQAKTPRSELSGGGVFTSASGITMYRGAAYGESFRGNAFLGEVANNIIYRQTVTPEGVTFKAERAEDKVEFVASTDTWFRPVNFVNAPDGTLHVLDMYREVIEHPWSIPDDLRALIDLENGRDRGRIYRLAPEGFKAPNQPRLGKATVAELVATLENPNAWWRETAHRLIFERQDQSAVAPLRDLFNTSTNALARLHALWSLQGLGALQHEELTKALRDTSPGVREHAIKLAEPHFAGSSQLLNAAMRLENDPEMRVRFQLVLSIGHIPSRNIAQALFVVAQRDAADPWMRSAILSGTPENAIHLVTLLLRNENFILSPPGLEMLRQLTYILGAQYELKPIYEVLNLYHLVQYCHCFIQESFWCGLGDGLRQAGKNFRSAFPNPESYGTKKVGYLFEMAHMTVLNDGELVKKRCQSIQLFAYDEFANVTNVLTKLMQSHEPQEVQVAAIRALSAHKDAKVASVLLANWRGATPAVREEVLTALFSRRERLNSLLDAVEAEIIPPAQINAIRRTSLLTNADLKLRARAEKLLGQNISSSRNEVIDKYNGALKLAGNKNNGEKVYETNCMVCHRAGEKGKDIGPHLESVRAWDAEKIILNILDPNREVAPNFISYELELKDGSSLSGIIASETTGSITLQRADGTQETVLRQNIATISSSGLSLMPDGLESNISPQDMADLVVFLQGK